MYRGLKCSLVAILVLCWWPGVVFGQTSSAASQHIGPDPLIQEKIDQLLRLASRPDKPGLTKQKFLEEFMKLRSSMDDDGVALIPQIVFYQRSVKDERIAWDSEFLLVELIRDLNKLEILNAVAPYLRNEDREIRRRFTNLIGTVLRGEPKVDFQPIFSLMLVNKGEIHDELIEFMFATFPGEALLGYMRFYKNEKDILASKEILLAEHIISDTLWKQQNSFLGPHNVEPDVLEQIDKLLRREEWWVRLYVAEIMRQHPTLRRSKITKRLKQDKHPLVQKTISSVAVEKQE